MKIINKYFDKNLILFKKNKFLDNRGYFYENYNLKKNKLIKDVFVQDNISFSKKKGVIRGLHFQKPKLDQSKYVSVIQGKILDVIVDLRKESVSYGKHLSFILSSQNLKSLFIPSGFAHGFSVLEDNTIVLYKVSKYYSNKHEITIKYDDSDLNIDWKIPKNMIKISKKDSIGIKFYSLKSPF